MLTFTTKVFEQNCGDIRLILRQRIDDLSEFRSTAGPEYGQRGESLGASQEYFSPTIVPSLSLLQLSCKVLINGTTTSSG